MNNSIVRFLDYAAEKYKQSIAFEEQGRSISFCDYQHDAVCVGTYLTNNTGLFRCPVLVYLPKSIDALISFMGILYSGNFYCPIPYGTPDERAKLICRISEADYIITNSEHLEKVKSFGISEERIILIENILNTQPQKELVNSIVDKVIDTDIAYLLFTSGSTGMPKGVAVPHRAVIDYMEWMCEEFKIDNSYSFANQAPFHFDASMPDVYLPLFSGAREYIVSDMYFMFPGKLVDELNAHNVNSLVWVPSALMTLSGRNVFGKKKLNELKFCMFCGEVMPNKHLNIWKRYYPDAVYINCYGPTEAAYACTYYVVDRDFDDDEPLPLGFPCKNTDIILLDDENKRINETDSVGELCIRGSSLAYGYYGNEKATSSSFVNDPTNKCYPEKIYRTGDLAWINERGELMFSGRKDFQIKHLGYRIELGEIENAVRGVKTVNNGACVYDKESDRIILFYEGTVETSELADLLVRKLPSYMMPQEYRHLDKMPLNINGKIDRTLLKSMI